LRRSFSPSQDSHCDKTRFSILPFVFIWGPFDLRKKTSRGTPCWRRLGCRQNLRCEGV